MNNLPKVVVEQRRGRASNPRLLDRKSDALPLSHRATQSAKMSDWSDSVLAAEATKAESASEVTRLIPRLPSRTDRLACIHCVSERLEVVICWTECLCSPSNLPRKDGQQMGNIARDELLGR